jgi:V/A-type H+-transporting ATPase subunit C
MDSQRIKKSSPLDYAFAIGRIRALENYLIRQEVFEEALDASLPEALKLFVESNLYGDKLLHIKNSSDLEKFLSKELHNLRKLMQDLILDKELLCVTDITNLARTCITCGKFKNEFLNDFLNHVVDMHNIKTFLRLYILKEPIEKLKELLTCEGFIKSEVFLALYEQDISVFLLRLEYVHMHAQTIDYATPLGESIRKLMEEDSFVALEKAIQDFLIEELKQVKHATFGPEPLIAYYFAKVNEIALVRMILLAKLNDVSTELVKERLNSVYA